MQINRNNYENFFLLYVDGELSAAERAAVEDFTVQNPDLLYELDMLKETVLPIDEIVFDKSILLKGSLIDESLEEKLLLKIDNELPVNEAAGLEKMLAANAGLTAEFDLLKRTKLDSTEQIIFEDKHLLYRRERDNVVIGRFVRWAAAAVLIGFGLYFGYEKLNDAQDHEIAAIKPDDRDKKSTGDSGTKQTQSQSAGNNKDADNIASNDNNSVILQPGDHHVTNADARKQHNQTNGQFTAKKDNNNSATTNNGSNPSDQNSVAQAPDNVQQGMPRNDNVSQEKLITEKKVPVMALNNPPRMDESIVPLENPYAHVAKLTRDDENDNKILYMDEDNVKKSKAGGLFRKVKRFVERTAKIKSGGSVSIGAFRLGSD